MIGQRDAPFTGTKSAVWVSVYVAICRAARVEHAESSKLHVEGFQRRWEVGGATRETKVG